MYGYYYTVPESKISDATYVAAIASLVGKNANFFSLSFFLRRMLAIHFFNVIMSVRWIL